MKVYLTRSQRQLVATQNFDSGTHESAFILSVFHDDFHVIEDKIRIIISTNQKEHIILQLIGVDEEETISGRKIDKTFENFHIPMRKITLIANQPINNVALKVKVIYQNEMEETILYPLEFISADKINKQDTCNMSFTPYYGYHIYSDQNPNPTTTRFTITGKYHYGWYEQNSETTVNADIVFSISGNGCLIDDEGQSVKKITIPTKYWDFSKKLIVHLNHSYFCMLNINFGETIPEELDNKTTIVCPLGVFLKK